MFATKDIVLCSGNFWYIDNLANVVIMEMKILFIKKITSF